MKPNRIILVRHGESEGNVDEGQYLTIPDYALNLTPKGVEQAQRAGNEIKEIIGSENLYVYLSPYFRTRQTYQYIRESIETNIVKTSEDPRIRELDWGHLRHPDDNEDIIRARDNFSTFYYRIPDGESGADVYDRVSTFLETLHRDFNNLLLLSLPSSNSCFHAVDGNLPVYSERESLLVQQVGEYSHVDRIIPTGLSPVPPASIFGSEPEHGWCYYYQKASLARQNGDWEEVGRLYDQTLELNLDTDDKSEIIPFFEGLVNLGRYDDARSLYNKQIKGQKEMRFSLCNFLSEDPGYRPEFGYDYETINEILCNS